MNDKIKAEKNFEIGRDFELHTLKKRDLEKRIRECLKDLETESGNEALQCKRKKEKEPKALDLQGVGLTNIGFYLITPLLLGVILGSFIDSKLSTHPVATIIFIVLGAVAMFYNLFRLTKKD